MNESDYVEFSKIYKRVMDIELTLKNSLFKSLQFTYNDKMFYVLIPYLKSNLIGRYKKYSKNTQRDLINDLINSKKPDKDKLSKFLKMAYLSDTLKILTEYKKIYQDTKFCNCFYNNKKINFNNHKKFSAKLSKLRNDIMHFDINSFNQNKNIYLETLIYWELLLYCKNCFIHTLPPTKPTINSILNQLLVFYPDIYKYNDRYLCDVFDTIALKNGLKVEKLPQYWSIGRQIYIIKKSINSP